MTSVNLNVASAILQKNAGDYAKRYGVASYMLDGLTRVAGEVNFSGRRVLELGGCTISPELTVGDLGVKNWTSVGSFKRLPESNPNRNFGPYRDAEILDFRTGARELGRKAFIPIDGDPTNLPEAFFEHFDIVIAFSALECVLDVVTIIDKAWRALVPGGVLATRFGPVWSCHVGHHAFVSQRINFQAPNGPIGPWGHLLKRPPQMLSQLLAAGVSVAESATTLEQLYTSPRINRYFSADYRGLFDASRFASTEFRSVWAKSPPLEIEKELRTLHPYESDFATGAWQTISRKE